MVPVPVSGGERGPVVVEKRISDAMDAILDWEMNSSCMVVLLLVRTSRSAQVLPNEKPIVLLKRGGNIFKRGDYFRKSVLLNVIEQLEGAEDSLTPDAVHVCETTPKRLKYVVS